MNNQPTGEPTVGEFLASQYELLKAEADRLRAIVDRLPKFAECDHELSGQPFVPTERLCWIVFRGFARDVNPFIHPDTGKWTSCHRTDFYPTKETAVAAGKKAGEVV